MTRSASLVIALLVSAGGLGAQDPPRYELRDTTRYSDGIGGGSMAMLHRDGEFVDSIALWFGLNQVTGGVAYHTVYTYSYSDECGGACIANGNIVFNDGKARHVLDDSLPHLHFFSFPQVIDSMLYYWGMRGGRGRYDLLAMRYDFSTGAVDSAFMYNRIFEGDTGGLHRPQKDGDLIRFGEWLFTPRLELVRHEDRPGS